MSKKNGKKLGKKSPRKVSKTRIAYALAVMVNYAKESKLGKGVAFISVLKKGDPDGIKTVDFKVVNGTFQRSPKYSPEDKGTNYFGVAMEKLAVMLATYLDSGTFKDSVKRGESPYRGGLVLEKGKYMYFVGFSGGSEKLDVEIAEIGMDLISANQIVV